MAGYNRVDIGSRATVLYDAEDPSKSIVYECSNYEVDDDADAPSDTTKA
jgi:hypothetical protein